MKNTKPVTQIETVFSGANLEAGEAMFGNNAEDSEEPVACS